MYSKRISTNSETKPRKFFLNDINEIKKTAQHIKSNFKKIWKVSKKKRNQTESIQTKTCLSEIKNTVESYFSRLEQVEDRILGLKDKMHIKDKTEEYLDKRLKNCERNMQELCTSVKGPNL
jgi:predicted  nucleic acid-binding Zn-ribbon protein